MSALDKIRLSSTLAVDSAAFLDYERFQPVHATTNPSILLNAAKDPIYYFLVEKTKSTLELAVLFGREILQHLPGHVSIQLDPRFSFDIEATIKQGHQLISLCLKESLPLSRVLVKIAGTWEGIRATEILEKEGIQCNVTMVFSVSQAIAAAEAGATCVAPYVGRVTDWHNTHFSSAEDHGIKSLSSIYHAVKAHGFPTQIMAASFRTPTQILAVSGCDILTIQPKLLDDLTLLNSDAPRLLGVPAPLPSSPVLNENRFRWQLCNDACASFLLDDGIRRFTKDILSLEKMLN